jgi:thiol-disulfide isomerase/thioredoxin
MTMLPRRAIAITAALAVMGGAVIASDERSVSRASPAETARAVSSATPVPAWTAVDIDGRRWSAEALRGRVVVIDFWATWCAPCLEELPRLKRLHERHENRGLTIIGVSLDRSSTREFRSWLQRQAIGWPQVREPGGFDGGLARAFAIEAVPASFVFGRDGRLQASGLRGPALEHQVTTLLEAR